jgi:hypothetical protein
MVGEFGMFWLSEFWKLDEQSRLIGDLGWEEVVEWKRFTTIFRAWKRDGESEI